MRSPSCFCRATRLSLAIVGSLMLILAVLPSFAQGTKDNGIINFGQPSFTLPDTYQAHFALGQEAMQKGDLDRAITEFSECVRIFKPYMGISKADISFDKRMADDIFFQPLSNALVNLGHALRQNNNLDKAIETYTMAADVCPGCVASHSSLGSALIAKANALQASASATHFPLGSPGLSEAESNLYRSAIAHLHVARQLDPQDASSYIGLSRALLSWGMRDGAVRQARSAVELAKDDPEAFLVLGQAMLSVGHIPEAAEAFKRAASLSTGNSASYQAVIQNYIGTVASASGDWAGALEAYKKAAELNPGCADYANNVGATLRNMGDMGWADTSLRSAVTLNPSSVEQYMNLAAALRDKGDFKAAAEAYRAALRFDPKNADLWHQFGVTLYSFACPDFFVKQTAALLQAEPGKQVLQQAVAQVGMHFIRDRKLTSVMAADPKLLDVTPRVALQPEPWGRLSGEATALADSLGFRPLCGGKRATIQNLLRNDAVARNVITAALDEGLVEVASSGKLAVIPDEIGVAAMTAEEAATLIGFGASLNYSDALMCSISALRKAWELAPTNGLVANNLGKALYEAGAIKEARGLFEKAIALTPDVPEVWKNRGIAAGRMGEMGLAASSFNRAIELDKSDAETYVLRGMACVQRAEFDNAYAMFNRGVMANNTYAPAMYYAGLTDLLKQASVPLTSAAVKHARLTTPLGQPHYSARIEFIPMSAAEKALGMIASANEKDPGLCKYFYYAGAELALPEAGGGVDIIHAVSANNVLLPEWASAANNMGVTFAARGDMKNAERLLRLAIEDAPEYALANYNLGRVLIADGRREAGEASLAKARNYASQQKLPYYFAVAGNAGMRTAGVGAPVATPRCADMASYTMRNLLEAFDITDSVW